MLKVFAMGDRAFEFFMVAFDGAGLKGGYSGGLGVALSQ